MGDPSSELTYVVEISLPGRLDEQWWRVSNTGTPAQTAAALSELATRIYRDLLGPGAGGLHRGRCWYHCLVCGPDGAVLDEVEGLVQAFLLSGELRTVSATITWRARRLRVGRRKAD
ncbi:hypothetical protein [Nocardia xishanensis]|uniref:Uncharacterized protein n=1 Tax=Nocardia xishanensis TaxID=238964 RepID=A0ABW7WSM9_9NOCA|nr:hypothetical protein [Nocardia xishanensis]